MKFATKTIHVRHYPPHLRHVATLPWEIFLKIQILCRYSADTEKMQCQNFENLLIFVNILSFNKVTKTLKVRTFLRHSVYVKQPFLHRSSAWPVICIIDRLYTRGVCATDSVKMLVRTQVCFSVGHFATAADLNKHRMWPITCRPACIQKTRQCLQHDCKEDHNINGM